MRHKTCDIRRSPATYQRVYVFECMSSSVCLPCNTLCHTHMICGRTLHIISTSVRRVYVYVFPATCQRMCQRVYVFLECMSSLQHAVPHTLDMWQDSTYPQVYGTACYKEAAGVMAHVKESRDMRTKHVGQFG